jgi:signal transduction histidine kinase
MSAIHAIPPLVTGSLYLATGIFCVSRLLDRKSLALPYSLWLFATVYFQLGWALSLLLSDPEVARLHIQANYSGIVFIPIALFHFVVTFLGASDRRFVPFLYGVGGIFAVTCWVDGWMLNGVVRNSWGFYARAGALHPVYLAFLTAIVLRIMLLLSRELRATKADPVRTQQVRLVRWAILVYVPASFDFSINYGLDCYPIGFVFTLAALWLISYAVIRHQLLDLNVIVRKTVVYSVLTALLAAIYAALMVFVARGLEGLVGAPSVYSSAFAAFVIAILVQPARNRIQHWMDHRYPRESLDQRLLREATGGFVHEIKRPLSTISLPAQLALRDVTAIREGELTSDALSKVEERLRFIVHKSSEAAETIEALRDLLIDTGRKHERIDLGSLIRELVERERSTISEVGLAIEINAAPGEYVVLGQRRQLELAMTNVLRNGLEAMADLPANSRKALVISLERMGDRIATRFSDQGKGIAPEDQARLFDPWFSKKSGSGMGLGLFLTREVLRLHHADVSVQSAVGSGTTFTMTFQAAPVEPAV